ncbi:MAG: hypothetical protein NVS1B13_06930 [Flavisolibacter sp.]
MFLESKSFPLYVLVGKLIIYVNTEKSFFLIFAMALGSNAGSQTKVVSFSMHNINLDFNLDKSGIPKYSVSFHETQSIKPSRLGFKLKGLTTLDSNFQVIKTDSIAIDETWKPVYQFNSSK